MKKIIPFIILIVVVFGAFYIIKIKKVEDVPVSQVPAQVDEQALVEKYIRENIKTLAPEEPVLGGSWYVIAVEIDKETKTGMMTYEDGHIQGVATFGYMIVEGGVVIENIIKK